MTLLEYKDPRSILSAICRRVSSDLQFSRIFLCDFFAGAAYAATTVHVIGVATISPALLRDAIVAAALICAMQAAKIVGVILLERRGGDAREFVASERLVTSGIYAYSRNPVYLVTIAQSATWSALLLRSASQTPHPSALVAAAALLLVGHFLSIDRLVIPNEEAALKRRHKEAFADYSRRVNRWFGRRRA